MHLEKKLLPQNLSLKKSLEKQANQQVLLKNLTCMVVGDTVLAHIIAFNWNQPVESTSGKLLIMMLEEMRKLGYNPVVSSDLSQRFDKATWIFVKTTSDRPSKEVVCLAPDKSDIMLIVGACNRFQDVVRTSITEAWPLGIQQEKNIDVCGELILQIRLNGNPWWDYEGEEKHTRCRQMLIEIIGQLGYNNFRLFFRTNIKGGTDSYFFIQDENYSIDPSKLAMISLNRTDRMRLINCRDMAESIRRAIIRDGNEIEAEEDVYGSWEFKLSGKPWKSYGAEAVRSKRLICRVSEKMLDHGWTLTNAIDISKSVSEKSVLLYSRSENYITQFACIDLSYHKILRLLDFPQSVASELKEVIEWKYIPGIKREQQTDESCYELYLKGGAWSGDSPFNLHSRSTLIHVLQKANANGWRLVASADVSADYIHQKNHGYYPCDVHSWYFVYRPEEPVSGSHAKKTIDVPSDLNEPPS